MVLDMVRGSIVNEKQMYEALKTGKISGYAIDVMSNELSGGGLTEDVGFAPLFECDNFIVSPYLGPHTMDAARNISVHIIKKAKEALDLA